MIPISVIRGSPTRIPPTRNGTDSSSAMFSFEQAPAVAPHLVQIGEHCVNTGLFASVQKIPTGISTPVLKKATQTARAR